jgi:hypothetical protein
MLSCSYGDSSRPFFMTPINLAASFPSVCSVVLHSMIHVTPVSIATPQSSVFFLLLLSTLSKVNLKISRIFKANIMVLLMLILWKCSIVKMWYIRDTSPGNLTLLLWPLKTRQRFHFLLHVLLFLFWYILVSALS